MASLTDTAEDRSLNWLTGNTTTAPVLPLMVRLVTTNGTDAAAGTEVPAGSGYAPKQATFGAASGGATSNTTAVSFGVLDSAASRTVTGFEIWDSATPTAVRWWHAPLTGGSKTIAAGETCEFAAGALTLSQQ